MILHVHKEMSDKLNMADIQLEIKFFLPPMTESRWKILFQFKPSHNEVKRSDRE